MGERRSRGMPYSWEERPANCNGGYAGWRRFHVNREARGRTARNIGARRAARRASSYPYDATKGYIRRILLCMVERDSGARIWIGYRNGALLVAWKLEARQLPCLPCQREERYKTRFMRHLVDSRPAAKSV